MKKLFFCSIRVFCRERLFDKLCCKVKTVYILRRISTFKLLISVGPATLLQNCTILEKLFLITEVTLPPYAENDIYQLFFNQKYLCWDDSRQQGVVSLYALLHYKMYILEKLSEWVFCLLKLINNSWRENNGNPWRRFRKVILIIIKFSELLCRISPRGINGLRSYIKHLKKCFIQFPNNSKLVKNSSVPCFYNPLLLKLVLCHAELSKASTIGNLASQRHKH